MDAAIVLMMLFGAGDLTAANVTLSQCFAVRERAHANSKTDVLCLAADGSEILPIIVGRK